MVIYCGPQNDLGISHTFYPHSHLIDQQDIRTQRRSVPQPHSLDLSFTASDFTPRDVSLMQTLQLQAAMSLRRALLVDPLMIHTDQ